MNDKEPKPTIYVVKLNMDHTALQQFMSEFNEMQAELAEDMLAATELSDARRELARIMEASRNVK